MRVIATKQGYFGKLREPGDVFDVADGSKATWFVAADAEAKPTKGGKAKEPDTSGAPAQGAARSE